MNKNKSWKDKWLNNDTWPESRFAQRVNKFLKSRNVNSILDLGCGGGRDSEYFSRKGYEVTALDDSESASQRNRLDRSKIAFIKGDIRNLRFKSVSFDVVYAHLSLHYFDDKMTTNILKRIYKIIKPGGYLFIKGKSTDDPLFGRGKIIETNFYDFGHPRHFFTKEYMSGKLKDFKILKIQRTNSYKYPGKASFIEAFAQKI